MPREDIQLSLKRPCFRALRQSSPHGIGAYILPFAGIALAAAQLRIPTIPLPKRQRVRTRKAVRHHAFPACHPNVEIGRWIFRRRTEKVDVVRHDRVSPHDPALGFLPHIQKKRLNTAVGQYALSLVCYHRNSEGQAPGMLSENRDECTDRADCLHLYRADCLHFVNGVDTHPHPISPTC